MELIEEVQDVSLLIPREQFFIDSLRPAYNILAFAGSTRGIKRSPEQIKNLIAITSKPVIQYGRDHEFIAEFCSVAEASRKLNLSAGNIGSCCNGHFKSTGGFLFRFKNNPKPYIYCSRKGNTPKLWTIKWPDGRCEESTDLTLYCKQNDISICRLRHLRRGKKRFNDYGISITKNGTPWLAHETREE